MKTTLPMGATRSLSLAAILLGFLWLLLPQNASANVYATNVRVEGGVTNVVQPAATNVSISYVLNEPATADVTITINNGSATVRTILLTNTSPGTLRGTNVVTWDGTDDNGTNVSSGIYTIDISPAAVGYDVWTEITDTNSLSNYIWNGSGIAVNKNSSSPYYGRIFLSNAQAGPNPDANPGDTVGLLKFNADLSPAEEGEFSDGGTTNWVGDGFSPWKLEVADDDTVYVADQTRGLVLSFDQLLSSNSLRVVLTTNNYPGAEGNLSGPFVTGTGTNSQLWLADTAYPNGKGIRRWQLTTNGVAATNDLGTTIVAVGSAAPALLSAAAYRTGQFQFTLKGQANVSYIIESSTNLQTWSPIATNQSSATNRQISIPASGTKSFYRAVAGASDLNLAPYDVAVDRSNRIYTIQLRLTQNDPTNRVFRFPPYAGAPEAAADWAIGAGDNSLEGAYGVAVDPLGQYVAVAIVGDGWPNSITGTGAARVFDTTNGTPIVTLASPEAGSFTDVAWDAVGNLYAVDIFASRVRSYSPPGTNQATTVALARVQFGTVLIPPVLTAPAYTGGQFQCVLNGQANVTYVLQASTDLHNWTAVATNTSANATRPLSVSAPGTFSFYRAVVSQ